MCVCVCVCVIFCGCVSAANGTNLSVTLLFVLVKKEKGQFVIGEERSDIKEVGEGGKADK